MRFEVLTSPDGLWNYKAQMENILAVCRFKGRRVHCIVEPEVKKRSTGAHSQNHHLNGHIQQFCQETGNEFEDVKNYLKRVAIKRGYPIKQHAGVDVMFRGLPVGISEADASTEDCAMLIEEMHILANEYGIILKEENAD